MDRGKWQSKIQSACKEAGTYRPFFDSVIETLSAIMETRDKAQAAFDESGGRTTVEHTNNGGTTNTVKNPALVVLMDCNTQALAYWRDLGLTPAGYKRLNADVVKDEKQGSLEGLLEKMMEE